jgi:acyl-CoA hydrolase
VPNRRRATIQVGIGAALDGVGDALRQKRKLTIYSEMLSDWAVGLMTGPRPAAHQATGSFLHGTSELMRLADHNEHITLGPADVVNDPARIARQRRMRAINTALEVDLGGNVNAEQIDGRVISAPGGNPNFMQGAASAKDGKAILALRSQNKFGDSTIVLRLHSGDLVTTPGQHVDHVVTEWGATRNLRGLAPDRRAYEILRVADPSHREALADQALAQGLINARQRQKLVRSVAFSLERARAQGMLDEEEIP